jgi:hypothetical protein
LSLWFIDVTFDVDVVHRVQRTEWREKKNARMLSIFADAFRLFVSRLARWREEKHPALVTRFPRRRSRPDGDGGERNPSKQENGPDLGRNEFIYIC